MRRKARYKSPSSNSIYNSFGNKCLRSASEGNETFAKEKKQCLKYERNKFLFYFILNRWLGMPTRNIERTVFNMTFQSPQMKIIQYSDY